MDPKGEEEGAGGLGNRKGGKGAGGWSWDAHTFWLSLILLRRTLICKKRRPERVTPRPPLGSGPGWPGDGVGRTGTPLLLPGPHTRAPGHHGEK